MQTSGAFAFRRGGATERVRDDFLMHSIKKSSRTGAVRDDVVPVAGLRVRGRRQYRTIASAAFSGSFAPVLQFEKLEIHTVFLHFPNFILEQNLSPKALAELRGVALKTVHRTVFCGLRAAVLFESDRYEKFPRSHTGSGEFCSFRTLWINRHFVAPRPLS